MARPWQTYGMTVAERFWWYVEKSDGCWIMKGTKRRPTFNYNGHTKRAAHVAWFLTTGNWPTKYILHSCDNIRCVRPDHLREGDQADNIQDAITRGRFRP